MDNIKNWMETAFEQKIKVNGNAPWLSKNDSIRGVINSSYWNEMTFEARAKFDCSHCDLAQSQVDDENPKNSLNFTENFCSGLTTCDDLYDVPVSLIVLLSVLYGVISVAAFFGNSLVLWIVTFSRRMRTVTNLFIANLAVADIIIGLFAIPFQFQAALLQRWDLPEFMCPFCPLVQALSINVSVFTLSAIAVDRYKAVLSPLGAHVSKRKAGWVILSIWAMGFSLAIPQALDYRVIHIDDHKTDSLKPFCANIWLPENIRFYYNVGLAVSQYFLPLIVITGAYIKTAMKLWITKIPGNKQESRDAAVLRNKKKVIRMCCIVGLLFAVFYLPFQLYNLLQIIFPTINEYQYVNIIWFGSHWLAMSNSCCNPFVYAIYNDKFQREFHARFRWLRRLCCNDNAFPSSEVIDKSRIRATYKFTNVRSSSHSTLSNNYSSSFRVSHSVPQINVVQSSREHKNRRDCQSFLSPPPRINRFSNSCRSLELQQCHHIYIKKNTSMSCGFIASEARMLEAISNENIKMTLNLHETRVDVHRETVSTSLLTMTGLE